MKNTQKTQMTKFNSPHPILPLVDSFPFNDSFLILQVVARLTKNLTSATIFDINGSCKIPDSRRRESEGGVFLTLKSHVSSFPIDFDFCGWLVQ